MKKRVLSAALSLCLLLTLLPTAALATEYNATVSGNDAQPGAFVSEGEGGAESGDSASEGGEQTGEGGSEGGSAA